ncbi:MAG: peptidylprolyl isomerase [Prevotella sp.]
MAALGTIRKRGAFLVIIIGLGLFAFIAEEMFRSCEATSNEKRQQVGEVLGKKISVQEFQTLVDEYQEVLKLTNGRDNLTEDELNNIKDMVWNEFVTQAILEKETEELGITVTDNELQNVLREGKNPLLMNSPFVNSQTGRFDVSELTKFLAAYKNVGTQNPQAAEYYQKIYNYWKYTEKNLRNQLLMEKYHGLLAHCILSNPVSAKMAFDDRTVEKTVQLASIAYSTIADDKVEVTEAELKAKYNSMKEMFKQPVETRDIKYVDFQVKASDIDHKTLLKSMNEVSASLIAGAEPAEVVRKAQSSIAFTGIPVKSKVFPKDISEKIDSMTVGQTTSPFETKYDNTLNVIKLISKVQLPDSVEYRSIEVGGATLDAARKTADSIYTALQAGADFEELAKKYGQEGKTNWFTSAMYENMPSFNTDAKAQIEAFNSLAVNEVKNLELSMGNIIIQVTNRKAFVDKYVAAVVKHTIDFSKATYSDAYNKFSRFVSENQTLEAMEKNAGKYGFQVLENNNLVNSAPYVVWGVRGTRDAMKWAFEAKPGEVSPLYECGENDHLLVLALTKVHPTGYLSLDDVKDAVKAEVLRDKKYEQIKAKLAGVNSIDAAKAKGAVVSTVPNITFQSPAYIAETKSSEPAISGVASATKQGQFIPRVIKGNAAAFMLQVTAQSQRQGEKFEAKVVENQLKQQALRTINPRYYLNELLLKSKMVDNRYLFF